MVLLAMADSPRLASPGRASLGKSGKYSGAFSYAVTKGRSSMGSQCLSTKPSQAKFSFGTSTREQWTDNSYLSAEHVKKNNTTALRNPGAKYAAPNSVGKQAHSLRHSFPYCGIGKERREVSKVPRDLQAYPGPGSYKPPSSMAAQVSSVKKTNPTAVFGTMKRVDREKQFIGEIYARTTAYNHRTAPAPGRYDHDPARPRFGATPYTRFGSANNGLKRFEYPKDLVLRHIPGAAAYMLPSGFKKQPNSTKATAPRAAFPKGKHNSKITISKGHEKELFGRTGPGPMTAPVINSCGMQVSSVKDSNSEWSFGKRPRFLSSQNNPFPMADSNYDEPQLSAGPGTYDA